MSPSHRLPQYLINFSKRAAVSGGSCRVMTLWLCRRLSKTSLWRLSSSWWVWKTLASSEAAVRTRSTVSLPLPFCSSSCSRCSSISEWLMVAAVPSPPRSAFWAAGRWERPSAALQGQGTGCWGTAEWGLAVGQRVVNGGLGKPGFVRIYSSPPGAKGAAGAKGVCG